MPDKSSDAFGAPGVEPRWTSSAKIGVGTAYHTACCVWFTLSHGIVNEIYYPTADCPNTRDLQLLITDGKTFCHEEKRDLESTVEMPAPGRPFYRITNRESRGRYRLIKEILTDPHRSVLLMKVKLEVRAKALRGKLRVFALLAPHVKRQGADNLGAWCELSTGGMLHAQRDDVHLVLGCDRGFLRRSVGYVGASDGWQDLRNFEMDWEFQRAGPGNIALTGEIDLGTRGEFVLGVGFGNSDTSAVTALLQTFATPFATHRKTFLMQWARAESDDRSEKHKLTGLARISRSVLLTHEDKIFQGATVASLSIPWGEIKGDHDAGGYHLVWTRDLVQTATALLSTGQTATPLRALIWLAATQNDEGSFPQNTWINGESYWQGVQLDETAALLLLAWRLRKEKALGLFDPWSIMKLAASFLVFSGPVTGQERWEENAGFSPSTLAAVIAGLAGAGDFAEDHGDQVARDFILIYADWLNANIEKWTVTDCGTVLPGVARYYLRLTPADKNSSTLDARPNTAVVHLKNGAGSHLTRDVVGADFLQLVRLGVRAADDPLIIDSLKVVDHVLKRNLPQGPAWRRFSFDGYGQKPDGSPFDGEGEGRCWPLLTGERGHYAIAAGKSAKPYLSAIENFANEGGMLPEQIWDDDDLGDGSCHRGAHSGSAMPLCWSHAEYLTLIRSHRDHRVYDRIDTAYARYARKPRASNYELWSLRYRHDDFPVGKTLRLVLNAAATVRWTHDAWQTHQDSEAQPSGLPNLWYLDLATSSFAADQAVEFTFFWTDAQRWEGMNFQVRAAGSA